MMRISIVAVLAALLIAGAGKVAAQAAVDSVFTITGRVEDTSVKKVSLLYMDFNTRRKRIIYAAGDTVQNGQFFIRSKAPATCLVKLLAGTDYDHSARFLLKAGNQYTITVKDTMGNALITGGEDKIQPFYMQLLKQLQPLEVARTGTYGYDGKNRTPEEKKQAEVLAATLNKQINHLVDSFVHKYPDSEISLQLVYQRVARMSDAAGGEALFAGLGEAVKNTPAGIELAAEINKDKAKLSIPARDFSQTTPDGATVSLSTYKGKYVLVDFWASWCGPCRAENPNVLKAYQLFHAKGLEILAVSLDNKKEAWVKAIEEDKLPWTQISDLKGGNNEVAKMYDINTIPQNFLVNPQGLVIARNLRGDELIQKLEGVFR